MFFLLPCPASEEPDDSGWAERGRGPAERGRGVGGRGRGGGGRGRLHRLRVPRPGFGNYAPFLQTRLVQRSLIFRWNPLKRIAGDFEKSRGINLSTKF